VSRVEAVSNSHSRSSSFPPEDEELRLPRPPGAIRRFWARHPLIADVLLALLCLVVTLTPGSSNPPPRPPSDRPVSAFLFDVTSAALPVVVVIACALLLRRRQWPLAAFVATYVVSLLFLFVSNPVGGPLVLVTSYTLAVYVSSRAAWIGLGVGMGSIALASIVLLLTGVVSSAVAVNAIVGDLVLGLIGTLIGVNVGGRKRYLEALIDRSRQLLVERDQQAQLAAVAERARIAREMHDIVSHSLTVIVALTEGAAATQDRERARDAATAAATTARGALTEMRAMLGVLRDGESERPLAPTEPVAPHTTVTSAQRAGYPVTLTVTGEADVSAATGYAIGRIVQEGLTNAMRHAPTASAITVSIDYSADPVVVVIENDGVTAPAGTAGFGLRGLTERAVHVNGILQSGPAGDGRWSLRAELPARRPGESDAAASARRTEEDT